jgi:hypothetical protein
MEVLFDVNPLDLLDDSEARVKAEMRRQRSQRVSRGAKAKACPTSAPTTKNMCVSSRRASSGRRSKLRRFLSAQPSG